jgi:hypothetical protein
MRQMVCQPSAFNDRISISRGEPRVVIGGTGRVREPGRTRRADVSCGDRQNSYRRLDHVLRVIRAVVQHDDDGHGDRYVLGRHVDAGETRW